MKIIIRNTIILLLLSFITSGYAQVFTPKWETCLGGTEWDEGKGIIFSNNSYFVVGTTRSDDGDISYNHGTIDMWFLNVDTNGGLIKEKTFGGSYAEAGFIDIKALNDTTFYLAAWSQSTDGDIGNNPWPGPDGNLWILQVNKQGDILWETMAGGSRTDELRDMRVTADGGILLLAFTSSYDGDVTGYHGGYDLWLTKIDSTGQKQWSKCFGGTGLEEGGSVIQTSDGGYMIVGDTDGRGGGNYDSTCNHHNPGSAWVDAWVVKLDSVGNIEWQQCFGGTYDDYSNNVIELSDGYIILGGTMSNDGDVSGYHSYPGPNSKYGGDIWVFKIDKTGNLLWQQCLGGTYNDFARNIFTTSDGGFMIVGSTDSNDGDVDGFHGEIPGFSLHDIWFVKIDSVGNPVWQYCYGGELDEMIYRGVCQKSDWDYVLAIATGTTDWKCYPSSLYDLRVSELYDSTMVNLTEPKIKINKVKVYPNPTNSILNIELANTPRVNNTTIEMIDINGKRVLRYFPKNKISHINIRPLKSGLYLVKIQTGNTVTTQRIIKR